MPRLRTPFLLVAALLLVAVAAGCGGGGGGAATNGHNDPVQVDVPSGSVAIVAGTAIPKADFDALFAQAEAAYKARNQDFPAAGSVEYDQLKTEIVTFLVQRVEFEQEAKTLGITVTDTEVDAKLDELKQQFFSGDEAKYQDELKQLGLTEAQLKDQLRASVLSQKIYDEVTKDAAVKPEDVQAYYDANLAQFTTPETRNVAHILVKTKAEAEAIIKELDGGADFAALAKAKSLDNQGGEGGSAAKGGELGEAPRDTYVKPFGDAAWALETGAISAPVESEFGWHVIKALGEIKPEKVTPFADVRDSIEQQLLQQERDTIMQAWVEQTQTRYAPKIGYALGFAPPSTGDSSTLTGAHTSTG